MEVRQLADVPVARSEELRRLMEAVKAPLPPEAIRPAGPGRLAFVMDATASREPTWEMARQLMAGMFRETASIGPLSMQLVFFRGGQVGPAKCQASKWTSDAARLTELMQKIECLAGHTQIGRALAHVVGETTEMKVNAAVLVGDACEDSLEQIYGEAARPGKLKTPVFAFQEGAGKGVEAVFRKIAKLSGGVYGRFDAGAEKQLGELLRATAMFAAGGIAALNGRSDAGSRLLLGQLKDKL
jgi:hypothetical protein